MKIRPIILAFATWLLFSSSVFSNSPLPLNQSYELEALDPQHRYGEGLNKVFNEWSAGKGGSVAEQKKAFIQELNMPNSELQKKIPKEFRQGVTYLNASERSQYSIEIDSRGKIMQNNKKLLPGEYMFVVGMDGKTYSAPYERGKMHHSSFFSGEPVSSAGMITIDSSGQISKLTNKSGHYTPGKPHLEEAAKLFQASLSKDARVDFVEIYSDSKGVKRMKTSQLSLQGQSGERKFSLDDTSIPDKASSGRIVGASANTVTIEKTTNGKTEKRKLVPMGGGMVEVFKVDSNGKAIGGSRKVNLAQWLNDNSVEIPSELRGTLGDAKRFRKQVSETHALPSTKRQSSSQGDMPSNPSSVRRAVVSPSVSDSPASIPRQRTLRTSQTLESSKPRLSPKANLSPRGEPQSAPSSPLSGGLKTSVSGISSTTAENRSSLKGNLVSKLNQRASQNPANSQSATTPARPAALSSKPLPKTPTKPAPLSGSLTRTVLGFQREWCRITTQGEICPK